MRDVFKVSNKDNRWRHFGVQIQWRHFGVQIQWRHSGDFMTNFEHRSQLFLVFLLLPLNN